MDTEDQNIKKLIGNIFQHENRLSNKYNNYTIEQVWRDTFGHLISGYTTKVNFYKGVLTVYISSSALKQEISMTKENVIEKINKNLKYKKVVELVVR